MKHIIFIEGMSEDWEKVSTKTFLLLLKVSGVCT
jgi:hypothetical protein